MEDNESRLCLKVNQERTNFNFVRQNMSIFDAKEICERVALFIRNIQSSVPQSKNVIESYEVFPVPTEEFNKVCIVWNPETRQIRFAVNGMDLWDAAVICGHAASYFSALLINPAEVWGQ